MKLKKGNRIYIYLPESNIIRHLKSDVFCQKLQSKIDLFVITAHLSGERANIVFIEQVAQRANGNLE